VYLLGCVGGTDICLEFNVGTERELVQAVRHESDVLVQGIQKLDGFLLDQFLVALVVQ